MATATLLQQQQQQLQMQEHNIDLMCRICAVDFKIATEGVPIFNTDQLMDKIKNYLHIQVKNASFLFLRLKKSFSVFESLSSNGLVGQK